ncbi:ovalbumin-related protein X-like [Neodiprion virginianus]|uniref:ovalbumin-related protein X-like n=1 Tax=Neodiprion virginianus TaxID=2961670 RepID=UPI001EE72228|nr:ovalbumin-related protein X-like [Neodiprion virginianus]
MRKLLLFLVAIFAISAQVTANGDSAALQAMAENVCRFADNFLKVIAADNPGNLISSSLSAQLSLAMAAYGAGGTTATQMRTALFIPDDNELGQSGYQSLIDTLNAVQGVELRLANKLFTSTRIPVKADFKAMTDTRFRSANQEVDFDHANAAANTINSWCDQQTMHRIKDLVTPDDMTPDTVLVIVNAIYFKGQWNRKFIPRLTKRRAFHLDAERTKNVSTMYVQHKFVTGDIPEVDARFIEIPYKDNLMSMIIIRPNEINGLKTVVGNLSLVNLTQRLRRNTLRPVKLFLPKFKMESTFDLKITAQKLGISEVFEDSANFSGIADVPIKIKKIVQKAFIEVNEEGSEAAVATGVISMFRSARIEPDVVQFEVDRPVMYAIRHTASNAILFSGLLVEP